MKSTTFRVFRTLENFYFEIPRKYEDRYQQRIRLRENEKVPVSLNHLVEIAANIIKNSEDNFRIDRYSYNSQIQQSSFYSFL